MSSKDWSGNSRSAFVQLGASSIGREDREKNDYYATDPRSIDDLFKYEKFSQKIWECAGGGGHLTKRMREHGKDVYSTDIIDRGCEDELVDFLNVDTNEKFDGDIITNPPYKYATEFILRALDKIADGHKVAMFLKLTTLEGQDRYDKLFSKYPPKTIYVYSKRIQCGKNGEFIGTSAVCYCWFVWVKGFNGDPIIKWITHKKESYEQLNLFNL